MPDPTTPKAHVEFPPNWDEMSDEERDGHLDVMAEALRQQILANLRPGVSG